MNDDRLKLYDDCIIFAISKEEKEEFKRNSYRQKCTVSNQLRNFVMYSNAINRKEKISVDEKANNENIIKLIGRSRYS